LLNDHISTVMPAAWTFLTWTVVGKSLGTIANGADDRPAPSPRGTLTTPIPGDSDSCKNAAAALPDLFDPIKNRLCLFHAKPLSELSNRADHGRSLRRGSEMDAMEFDELHLYFRAVRRQPFTVEREDKQEHGRIRQPSISIGT
jgi:hypothetical protein